MAEKGSHPGSVAAVLYYAHFSDLYLTLPTPVEQPHTIHYQNISTDLMETARFGICLQHHAKVLSASFLLKRMFCCSFHMSGRGQ